jgi:hypothetical protein
MNEITVVIPTFNRGALLRRAIESVLRQTLIPHQIIVVDDGSEDDTVAICESYRGVVEFFRQSNAGASAARNVGIQRARHPWLAFLDSDDYWTETHLERLSAAITSTSGAADLYFADMQMPDVDGGGTLWQQIGFSPNSPYQLAEDATAWALMKRQPMMLQASVISRHALVRQNGLDVRFRLIHDSYLFCQLAIGASACAVSGVGCVQTADDQSQVRLTTAIPLESEGKLRESCEMWGLVHRNPSLPEEFRRLVRFNYAGSRLAIAKRDIKAGRYGGALTNVVSALAFEPQLAWWVLVHRSLHGYEQTVRPSGTQEL